MGLLSLLGSKQLSVTVLKGKVENKREKSACYNFVLGKHALSPDDDVGVIATLLNKPGDLTK